MKIINISSEYIKLDSLLKFSGLAESGGHAKSMILNGEVWVNNEKCQSRGTKIYPGDRIKTGNIEVEVRRK